MQLVSIAPIIFLQRTCYMCVHHVFSDMHSYIYVTLQVMKIHSEQYIIIIILQQFVENVITKIETERINVGLSSPRRYYRDCQFVFTLEAVCNVHIPKRYRSLMKRISLPICNQLQNGTSLEPDVEWNRG